MGKPCAYYTLAVLFIVVHSAMAFKSDIHENMTKAQRLEVFDSEDSIPEYEVFSTPSNGARITRQADDHFLLTIEMNGKQITLNLQSVSEFAAMKQIPVWFAKYDQLAYRNVRYDPLTEITCQTNKFKMYQDVTNEAAVMAFEDRNGFVTIDGYVGAEHRIRSLPKERLDDVLRYAYSLDKVVPRDKRLITSNTGKDRDYYVVYKIKNPPEDLKDSSFGHSNNIERVKRAIQKAERLEIPQAVYPKILIVIDHTVLRDPRYEIKRLLLFWNAVHLMFRTLDRPKVYPIIVGIILSTESLATPYIYYNGDFTRLEGRASVLNMGNYFYSEPNRFPKKRYDLVVAMTRCHIDVCTNGQQALVAGFKTPNGNVCSSRRERCETESIPGMSIVEAFWRPIGIRTVAEMIAYFLGAKHAAINGVPPNCTSEEGLDIRFKTYADNHKMGLSQCSIQDYYDFFSSNESLCLDTKLPLINNPDDPLPGMWLSLNGQCQNEGYVKACKPQLSSLCAKKSCRDRKSNTCVLSREPPLPGTKCGIYKRCNFKRQCVYHPS